VPWSGARTSLQGPALGAAKVATARAGALCQTGALYRKRTCSGSRNRAETKGLKKAIPRYTEKTDCGIVCRR
jgi:hypothetical protein